MIKIRKLLFSDYKYDIQTGKLIPTQPLPNGVSFIFNFTMKEIFLGNRFWIVYGRRFCLCRYRKHLNVYDCSFEYLFSVGGNDIDNRPLSDCYCLTTRNSNETWIKLPNLPVKLHLNLS